VTHLLELRGIVGASSLQDRLQIERSLDWWRGLLEEVAETEAALETARQQEQTHADNCREATDRAEKAEAALETAAAEGCTLTEFVARNGEVRAEIGTALAGYLAANMAAFLDEHAAENYCEMVATNKNGKAIILRIQRAERPTPHELRKAAEADRDRLRSALEACQWGNDNICPECGRLVNEGHAKHCSIGIALAGPAPEGGAG